MSSFTLFTPMSGFDETVTTSTTALNASPAPAGTSAVRLCVVTGDHHVAFHGEAADAENMVMKEGATEYFRAGPNQTISVRTVSGAGEISVSWLRNPT